MADVHAAGGSHKPSSGTGVTHLFTLCGGHIQAIYDGCIDEEIRVVDVRHEVDRWARGRRLRARVTGRPGVALRSRRGPA